MVPTLPLGSVYSEFGPAYDELLMPELPVEQAIEHVQELPPVMLGLSRWKPVSLALWDALDFPDDTGRLATAGQMLSAALAAEGWLEESPA